MGQRSPLIRLDQAYCIVGSRFSRQHPMWAKVKAAAAAAMEPTIDRQMEQIKNESSPIRRSRAPHQGFLLFLFIVLRSFN